MKSGAAFLLLDAPLLRSDRAPVSGLYATGVTTASSTVRTSRTRWLRLLRNSSARCANAPAERLPRGEVVRFVRYARTRHCTKTLFGSEAIRSPGPEPAASAVVREVPHIVTTERTTPDLGEPPSAFCPRCGRRSDPAAVGGIVGLCHCSECGQYACRWCWEGQPATVRPATSTSSLPSPPPRRNAGHAPSLRSGGPACGRHSPPLSPWSPISVLALTLGGGFRSAGGVEGATAAPARRERRVAVKPPVRRAVGRPRQQASGAEESQPLP